MDVKYKLPSTENSNAGEPFDKEIFDAVLAFSNSLEKRYIDRPVKI